MTKLEQTMEFFKNDQYATETTGIQLIEVDNSYAKCTLLPESKHKNAAGMVMGGALFTLADFAIAVASNFEKPLTVTLNSQVHFLSSAKNGLLTAKAHCIKEGKTTGLYQVTITDESEKIIALVTSETFRVEQK